MEKRLLGDKEFDSFNYWSTVFVDSVNSQISIADTKIFLYIFFVGLRFISLDYLNSIYENHRPSRNICFEIIFEKLSQFVNAPILSVPDQILRKTNARVALFIKSTWIEPYFVPGTYNLDLYLECHIQNMNDWKSVMTLV